MLYSKSYRVILNNMLKVAGCLSAAFIILTAWPLKADAQPDWQIDIKVQSGSAYNNLVLGGDSTATDGFDNLWEVYAYLGGQIRAYFPHSAWGMTQDIFWRDIRMNQPATTKAWTLDVDSDLTSATHTVSWDLSKVPSAFILTLVDNSTTQQIDMRTISSYNFAYSGIRTFTISVTTDSDSDGDGLSDSQDNCLATPNPGQQNTDGDAYGNMCDADLDNDGFVGPNDYTMFGQAWWSNSSSPNWNPDADFDSDGFVGPNDYTIFGTRWWSSEPWH